LHGAVHVASVAEVGEGSNAGVQVSCLYGVQGELSPLLPSDTSCRWCRNSYSLYARGREGREEERREGA
jgi:hypothetical protein